MYSLPWAKADLAPFDPTQTDKAKIEAGHPVPCRLCEGVYRVLTVTARYCSICERGYCQSQHGAWVGGRGACIQCGPLRPGSLPVQADGVSMVAFDVFWERLKGEFANRPQVKPGIYVVEVNNWTRDRGENLETFAVRWEGGDTFYWETVEGNARNFSASEARKVYEVWADYLAGRVARNFITNTLNVHNSKGILSLFRKFQRLMS